MIFWLFHRRRSPFRRLEEDEESRREGFMRPRQGRPLFTRLLRYGALGALGYFGARAVLRSPWGQQQWNLLRQRYPGPFNMVDRWVRSGVERLVDWSLEEALEHPGMPRYRPVLVAAQGVQFADRRLRESLLSRVVIDQLQFSAYESQHLKNLQKVLGLQTQDEAIDFVRRMHDEGIFQELFATRTRRSYLMSWADPNETSDSSFIARRLLTSPSFYAYRRRLEGMNLSQDQIEELSRQYFAPLIHNVVGQASRVPMEYEQVHEELRRAYYRAATRGEIDDSPAIRSLLARGYKKVNLVEALGYGYTIKDPKVAWSFRYVSPEHYKYLNIFTPLHELPSEVRDAIRWYRVQREQILGESNPDEIDKRLRQLEEMVNQDPIKALARFLYYREDHRPHILLEAYDLAGLPRPRRYRGRNTAFETEEDHPDWEQGKPLVTKIDKNAISEVLGRLHDIDVSTMVQSPDTGRVIDLSFVPGALEYSRQGWTRFAIPVAPGMFMLQPFRLFPWLRPNVDWFVHLDPTAQQPIVAQSLGKKPWERLDEDVFLLGSRAVRVGWQYQDRAQSSVPPGVAVDYPLLREIHAVMSDMPGEWTSMRVEGMSMRGMMESLINARPGDWRESARLRMEDSWFAKAKRRFFPDPDDMSDPRNVWARLIADDTYINKPLESDMARRLASMFTTFVFREDFDSVAFLREFVKAREELRSMRLAGHPAQQALQDPDLVQMAQAGTIPDFHVSLNWDAVLKKLAQAKDEEEALSIFMNDEFMERFRQALYATMFPLSENRMGKAAAMDLGLISSGARMVEETGTGIDIEGSFYVSVQSSQFMNYLNMRSSLFPYLYQHYTPDRPESLFDPVTGSMFGVPDPKLRISEFLRAMVLEASMQELRKTRETDDLMYAALTAARRMGDERAAAWFMGALFREAAEADPATNLVGRYGMSNLLMLRQMAKSGQIGELYKWGIEAFERELTRQWQGLNVIDEVDVDEDPMLRASVFVMKKGPRIGSFEWFTGYLTRWNRVENESDLYRYFVGWRLNEMLRPYGLALGGSSLSSGGRALRDIALYRLMPALGGYLAWRYINTEMRHLFGYAPADLMADTFRMAQMGSTRIMDVTGITRLKKFLVNEIPGLDVYFNPRSADELEFYHRYGLSTIRYGRGWLSGSRTPLVGEGVQANLPTWYRGIRSYWQAAPNADIATLSAYSRGDVPLPTPRNPLAPVFYVVRRTLGISDRQFAERHRKDRPYPIAYRDMEAVPSPAYRAWKAASIAAGPAVSTQDVSAQAGHVQSVTVQAVPSVSGAGSLVSVGGGGVQTKTEPRPNFRSFMLAVGMSPRLREELVTAPGAETPVKAGMPVTLGASPVETARVATRNIFHQVSEIQGLYGWFNRLVSDAFFGRENPIVTEDPAWAYSFSRRFWESLYGGLDILPWSNELNELLRRFVPRRRATEYVYYNPIPNTMPYWMPERLRYGDPYVRVYAGELRLPGAAYRWANPARFGVARPGPHDISDTNLLTLPAEAIGMDRERQFAVLTGMERAAGLRTQLSDQVINRVARRYLEQFSDDVAIYRDIITRDDENRVSAYTMLMVGEGRHANIVHAVPADMDIRSAKIAMMERMRQLGVRRGELLVVTDEQTGAFRRIPVRRDDRVLSPHLARWRRFRESLIRDIESGDINEGMFYSPLQRFEVLADVSPKSSYFRHLKSAISANLSKLTDEERRRFEYARDVAERTGERYHLYPYRLAPLEAKEARALGFDEEGRLRIEGQEKALRLAGIQLRFGEIKRRYGLPENAPREEALRRLAEEFGLTDRVELLHSGIRGTRRAPRYIVRARGRNLNRLLLRSGLAVRDEEDESMESRYLRWGPLRRLWTRLVDFFTHLDTPFHTKFLRVRSPLEEWERSHVFGTRSGSWESPIRTYVKPTITAIINKNPIYAAMSGAFFGSLFGFTVGAKREGLMYGAAAGFALSLMRSVVSPRGYIPSRTRRKWEIDEYIDALQYTKYMRLAREESELAKRLEGTDVDQLLRDMQEQDREQGQEAERRRRQLVKKLDRVRRRLSERPSDRLREEEARLLSEIERLESDPEQTRRKRRKRRKIDFSSLGDHARRALLYRAMAEQTAAGTGTARTHGEALRTVRPYVRDIYRQILETGTPKEKRRFYELLPDYHKVVFHDLLAPDLPLPKRPDPTRLFRKYGLPGPSWRGWDPDVDLELLRSQLLEQGGLDPVEAGVFPTERAVSRLVLEQVGVPVPITRNDVAARLATLLGESNWQRVMGASGGGRLGSSYYTYVDYYDREYEKNVYKHYIRSLSALA